MKKLSFSGHETFACKIYWLKKGYDFVKAGNKFTSDDAVVDLGVGKNMVASIRFWLKAFGLLEGEDQLSDFAEFIFDEKDGVDPYLEDQLTLWLLHYQLIKNDKASLYNLVFNQFRRERIEFTKEHLKHFVNRITVDNGVPNPTTLENDIRVFLANYVNQKISEIEESYNNILQELSLIANFKQLDDNGHLMDWYQFNLQPKDIPVEGLLYVILDNSSYGQSISLTHLANDPSSLGNVFLLTEGSLIGLLKQIPEEYANYTETAGNQVLQLKNKLDKYDILRKYYIKDYANI